MKKTGQWCPVFLDSPHAKFHDRDLREKPDIGIRFFCEVIYAKNRTMVSGFFRIPKAGYVGLIRFINRTPIAGKILVINQARFSIKN
jgi:hypothetical protein